MKRTYPFYPWLCYKVSHANLLEYPCPFSQLSPGILHLVLDVADLDIDGILDAVFSRRLVKGWRYMNVSELRLGC